MPFRAMIFLASLIAVFATILARPAHSAPLPDCSVTPSSPLVVDVKDMGAKGDGRANDTASIQKAINEIAGTGGTVLVPNGVYMVETVGKQRLQLRSKMTFKMASRAVLKAIPNDSKSYSVLVIGKATDVNVVGGTLLGDRTKHKSKKGEWGMGVKISGDVARVTVVDVTAKDMWGDGFYVQEATDVALCSIVADHNRRQGLSIISVNRMLVTDSAFRATRGTRPSAGIDMEPDKPEQKVNNVRIQNSKFSDNAGGDIVIAGKKGTVANVEILHNEFRSSRPILIENAPAIRSTAICKNRQITERTPPHEGFSSFAEAVEVVSLQADCNRGSDLRFEVNRVTKKKNRRN